MKSKIAILFALINITLSAKVLIISDIDDTIKKANSTNSVSVVWYFLKADPYTTMAGLYQEIKNYYEAQGEEVEFIYLSAAYDATFNQDPWLKKHGFPYGKTILRKIGDGKTYEYKYSNLKRILSKENPDEIELFLFGDNSDQDPRVYKDIVEELQIPAHEIFIRDVSTYATYWQAGWEIQKISGVNYFFSEMELRFTPQFYFLSGPLSTEITTLYQSQTLIPDYTFETLKQRIEKAECNSSGYYICKKNSEKWADNLWNDYHGRM